MHPLNYDGAVSVPRDFARGPLFAAVPQKTGRMVSVGSRQYQIGGFAPLGIGDPCPALDVRHLRAILALLSFRDPNRPDAPIRPSFYGLCRRFSRSDKNSGKLANFLRSLLDDLLRCFVKVSEGNGTERAFRILERVSIVRRAARRTGSAEMECWLEELRFSAEFNQLLLDFEGLARIRLDTLNSLASPIAQALYAFAPSRAVHYHSPSRAWEIRLAVALGQLGLVVANAKSARKRVFVQNAVTPNGSIMAQLDGAPLLDSFLRVELVETSDGMDYKLRFWSEGNASAPAPCFFPIIEKGQKLLEAWLASGRVETAYRERLKCIQSLSKYENELLEAGQIDQTHSAGFLRIARALIGERRFDEIAAESKADALSTGGFRAINPTGLIIHRLIEAVRYGTPNKLPNVGMGIQTSHAVAAWETKQGA